MPKGKNIGEEARGRNRAGSSESAQSAEIDSRRQGIEQELETGEDRKRAEEALRDSEARYRRLVENAPVGIISVGKSGEIIDVNETLVHILGSPSREATQGVNMFSFPRLVEAGVAHNFRRCLETGESGVYETPYRSKWGKDLHLRYHLTPIRDREGRLSGVQGIVEDISEPKRLAEQLIQAQKMEAIGTLAGGIAHDFNNILAAILGYAELASLDIAAGSRASKNIQLSIQATHRAKELVKQILAFSRQGKQERRPLDIRPLIREGLKLLRASLPATIDIQEKMAEDIGLVEADPTQIHQILMNLCTNSAHAMNERGGTLKVALENVGRPENAFPGGKGESPDAYVKLTVQDTGYGMTQEVLKRIFDPYFTTKEVGRGTGLGLAVVHGIVKNHGGLIQVSSEAGKGTVVEVFLPQVEGARKARETEKTDLLPLGGSEKILLVDDEATIVEIGKGVLEHLGYRVEGRTRSMEALALFRERSQDFDLIITDMTMPQMTGDELAREVLKIRPDIPVVLCTGYSERISEEKAKEMGIQEFVMKPLVISDFARTIRRALDWKRKEKRKK